jgi:hypothetical protein
MKIPISQQIAEVERELYQRRKVYPRLEASGKFLQGQGDHYMARMEAVRDTLEWIARDKNLRKRIDDH